MSSCAWFAYFCLLWLDLKSPQIIRYQRSNRKWQRVHEPFIPSDCVRLQLPVPIWMEGSSLFWDCVCVWCSAQPPSPLCPRIHLHPSSKWIHLPVPPGDCGAVLRERLHLWFLSIIILYVLFIYAKNMEAHYLIIKLPLCSARPGVTISDPFFNGSRSSWMSFAPMTLRHRSVFQLQFQPLSPDGILVYVAQHLSARAGEDVQLFRRFRKWQEGA